MASSMINCLTRHPAASTCTAFGVEHANPSSLKTPSSTGITTGQIPFRPTPRRVRLTASRPRLHAWTPLQKNLQRLPEAHVCCALTPANDDSAALPSTSRDDGASSSDESTNTEIKIDLKLPRRSRLVTFTCNICAGRTDRLVNPIAWEKGMVIVQCQHCQVWHKIADAANLVEEIRYAELEEEAENSDAE